MIKPLASFMIFFYEFCLLLQARKGRNRCEVVLDIEACVLPNPPQMLNLLNRFLEWLDINSTSVCGFKAVFAAKYRNRPRNVFQDEDDVVTEFLPRKMIGGNKMDLKDVESYLVQTSKQIYGKMAHVQYQQRIPENTSSHIYGAEFPLKRSCPCNTLSCNGSYQFFRPNSVCTQFWNMLINVCLNHLISKMTNFQKFLIS